MIFLKCKTCHSEHLYVLQQCEKTKHQGIWHLGIHRFTNWNRSRLQPYKHSGGSVSLNLKKFSINMHRIAIQVTHFEIWVAYHHNQFFTQVCQEALMIFRLKIFKKDYYIYQVIQHNIPWDTLLESWKALSVFTDRAAGGTHWSLVLHKDWRI